MLPKGVCVDDARSEEKHDRNRGMVGMVSGELL